MASRFTRGEIRKILGDAHTEEIENQLIALHLGVVDPMKDDLARYKAESEKLPEVQKELDNYKNGTDWKAEHDKVKSEFDNYKAEVAGKERLAAKQRAFRKLLSDENIPDKFHDRIVKMTDFDAIEMDGNDIKDAQKQRDNIKADWGEYVAVVETKGDKPETPPKHNDNAFESMSLADKMKYANENPNAPEVTAWLNH